MLDASRGSPPSRGRAARDSGGQQGPGRGLQIGLAQQGLADQETAGAHAVQPFEEGRQLAAGIPGARFVALEGRNHLVLEGEPAWDRLLAEIKSFLRS